MDVHIENGVIPQKPEVQLEFLVSEILESLSAEQIKDLAQLFLMNKYKNLSAAELTAEYVRFNNIESDEELIERLGQY